MYGFVNDKDDSVSKEESALKNKGQADILVELSIYLKYN